MEGKESARIIKQESRSQNIYFTNRLPLFGNDIQCIHCDYTVRVIIVSQMTDRKSVV